MPLLVAIVDPPHLSQSGDWWYRSASPARALAALPDVHVVNVDGVHRAHDQVGAGADILILNNVCDADLLPVIAERRRRGLVTVFEINDDVTAVQPWNSAYGFYRQRENLLLFFLLARECDALQFSSVELERLYGHLHTRRRVFANQLEAVSPPREQVGEGPLVIGWGGSHGHLQDMARIAAPLCRFVATHDARLHLMGAESIWQLFDALPAEKKSYTPPGTISDYRAFLRSVDVGIAPLDDTAFNRCRSDVKFLEYAAEGAVPLVQRAPAYASVQEGQTGLLFGDADELVAQLTQVRDDRSRLARIRAAAWKYVSEERREAAHAEERLAFYTSLGGRGDALPAAERFAALADSKGATIDGRCLILQADDYEQLLHEGIAHKDQVDEARALFARAARLAPKQHLPDLYAGMVGGDATDYRAALAKNPRSVRARLGLAIALAQGGHAQAALGQLLAVGEAVPSYAAPFRLAAQLVTGADAQLFAEHAERLTAGLER